MKINFKGVKYMSFEQYALKKEQARELAVILATLHEFGYELDDWEKGYLSHMLLSKKAVL